MDSAKPFAEIEDLVVPDAPFECQAPALADVTTVKGWVDWVENFVKNIASGCTFDVQGMAWDEDRRCALYFATFHAKHTGDGGPVPATQKETHTHYCYIVKMNVDAKVEHITKVWNDGYCLSELGWA